MTLNQKTSEILSDSIKSAVFIDEKAVECYGKKPNLDIIEEKLSKNLYHNFKKNGVSLDIHKFRPKDIEDKNTINYLFKNRDLILLDWKLDGISGEAYSLSLLSKVVQEKHIHFCCLYTSEGNYNSIINNILSYFSGFSKQYYEDIIETLDAYQDGYPELFEKINGRDLKINGSLYGDFSTIDRDLPDTIKKVTSESNFGKALIQIKLAFNGLLKAPNPQPVPNHINRENYTLNINNTIITIISKKENSSHRILRRLKNQLLNSNSFFTELLGLDMQNSFNNSSSFLDENILKTSLNTLMYHRKQLKNSDLQFEKFIKDILIEQSKLTLQGTSLKILNNEFLDKISKKRISVKDEDVCTLNSFYNGSYIDQKKKLNFGDILKSIENNEYYLCITPLCDCLFPENIKNNYYFVKGVMEPNLKKAFATGDGGYKSFINNNICVLWTEGEFIKPLQINIENSNFNENKVAVKLFRKNALAEDQFEYIFTLKSNYAQRIANHTFSHPLRVGVDFVK